jgi:hypothetical protein
MPSLPQFDPIRGQSTQTTGDSLIGTSGWYPRPELNLDQRFRKLKQTTAKQGKNCEFDTAFDTFLRIKFLERMLHQDS